MAEIIKLNRIESQNLPTISVKGCVGKMITKSELEECRKADINSFDINDLTDITNLNIDTGKSIINRTAKYFETVKNPYMFRVGDVGVKINCIGDKSLADSIINLSSYK